MDAGVPPKSVLFLVLQWVLSGEQLETVLTDIQGLEDFLDMDFKVCEGTAKGITAMQMDNKAKLVFSEILRSALLQAQRAVCSF